MTPDDLRYLDRGAFFVFDQHTWGIFRKLAFARDAFRGFKELMDRCRTTSK